MLCQSGSIAAQPSAGRTAQWLGVIKRLRDHVSGHPSLHGDRTSSVKAIRIVDHFFTLTEAAAKLNVNPVTIRRWIQAGKLGAQRVGGVVFITKREIQVIHARKRITNAATE